jgi:hypothetical protein
MLRGITARRTWFIISWQKGFHSGSKGCKDQLLISKNNISGLHDEKHSMDHQKAFDSVPQSWLEKSIDLMGVNNRTVKYWKLSMEKWKTSAINKQKINAIKTYQDRETFQGYRFFKLSRRMNLM